MTLPELPTALVPDAPPTLRDLTLSEATVVMPVPASVAFEGLDISFLQTRTAIAATSYLAAVLRRLTPRLPRYVEHTGSLPRFGLSGGWFDDRVETGMLSLLETTVAAAKAFLRAARAQCRAFSLRFVLDDLALAERLLLQLWDQVSTYGRVRARMAHRASVAATPASSGS